MKRALIIGSLVAFAIAMSIVSYYSQIDNRHLVSLALPHKPIFDCSKPLPDGTDCSTGCECGGGSGEVGPPGVVTYEEIDGRCVIGCSVAVTPIPGPHGYLVGTDIPVIIDTAPSCIDWRKSPHPITMPDPMPQGAIGLLVCNQPYPRPKPHLP